MGNLIFGPGPQLIWRDLDCNDGEPPVDTDVADRAIEFLFEPVTLDPRLTLGDVFKLVDICPPLHEVFRRNFAESLCAEARKGPLPQAPGSDPDEVSGVEYLELYGSWGYDPATRAYSSVHRLDLRGVGPVLEVDAADHGVKAGDRIRWDVSLTPGRELLDLPLRFREEFDITADRVDAGANVTPVAHAKCAELLLGQAIHSILYGLSFFGGPAQQAQFLDKLTSAEAYFDSGAAKAMSGDELLEDLGLLDFETLFESFGGVSPSDVSSALPRMPDDEPAGPWLEREFAGQVVVKAQFRDRQGREFRKAFLAAGR